MNVLQFPLRMAAERSYLRLVQRSMREGATAVPADAESSQQENAYDAAVSEGWPDRHRRA